MLRYTNFVAETRRTLRGFPFTAWKEDKPMPRIDDTLLDCAIYLYRNVEEATQARRAGGSGFLASVPGSGAGWLAQGKCPHPGLHHVYGVTNRHVILGD